MAASTLLSQREQEPRPAAVELSVPSYVLAVGLLLGVNATALLWSGLPVLVAALLCLILLTLIGEAVLRLLPGRVLPGHLARSYLAGCCGLVVLLGTVAALQVAAGPLDVEAVRPGTVLLVLDLECLLALWLGRHSWQQPLRRPADLGRQVSQLHLGAALPLAAAIGVIVLQDGRTGALTLVLLLGCATYVSVLLAMAGDTSRAASMAGSSSLALTLFATSVRRRYGRWRGRSGVTLTGRGPPGTDGARREVGLLERGRLAEPVLVAPGPVRPAVRSGSAPVTAGRGPGRSGSVPEYAVALFVLLCINAAPIVFGQLPVLLATALCIGLLGVLGEAVLRLLPVQVLPERLARAYLAGCCGLAVLLIAGLALNTFLPPLGVEQPLRPLPVLFALDYLCLAALWLGRDAWRGRLRMPRPAARNAPALLISAVLPLAATAGAIALDNGRSAGLTIAMLYGCAAYICVLLVLAPRVARSTLVLGIYGVALALLLMTSMRGRYVTGHDIQIEYYVFQLTHAAWRWDIGSFSDAYNSCLSVNIVPTMLVGIFHVPDELVFKFLYQVLFAACPVGVFLVAERIAGRRAALMSAVVFMAFPTFFSDMPMLTRQQMAFLLLSAMTILVMNRTQEAHRQQRLVFIGLGLGGVLSHYSTTYLMILQFGLAALAAALLARWPTGAGSGAALARWRDRPRLLTVPLVGALAAMAVLWGGVVTDTGGSLAGSLRTAFSSVTSTGASAGSEDASTSLLGGTTLDPEQLLDRYVDASLNARLPGRDYPAPALVAGYPVSTVEPERAPLTAVGRALEDRQIDVYAVVAATRTASAQALQVLLVVGVICLFVRRRARITFDPEFVLLALGGLLMLVVFVLLPTLTLDYGLLRVFQQALIVLALPTALGCAVLMSLARAAGSRLVPGTDRERWATGSRSAGRPGAGDGFGAGAVLPVLFLVSSTGLIAAVTGGYLPQLHLANAGENYDSYVLHDGEVAAAGWLVRQSDFRPGETGNAQADLWTSVKVFSREQVRIQPVVVPGAIADDSYVLVGYNNLRRGVAQGGLLNQPVSFTYPTAFLEQDRNLVYSTGETEVFR